MNRYDYYTRRANFDEQEWLTEELCYPEQEDSRGHDRYTPSYEEDDEEYEECDYGLYDEDLEYMYDDEDDPEYMYEADSLLYPLNFQI